MDIRETTIFIIKGKVQGVYYRVSIQRAAQKVGFNGYVKNLPNGDVEAGVYCKKENLEKFVKILKLGSSSSKVKRITRKKSELLLSKGFEIRS